MWLCSQLLKESLTGNFTFCAVTESDNNNEIWILFPRQFTVSFLTYLIENLKTFINMGKSYENLGRSALGKKLLNETIIAG